MYKLLLGPAFDFLPSSLRALHQSPGTYRFSGTCTIRRDSSLVTRLLAFVASLPPAGTSGIEVTIESYGKGEVWTRQFGAHRMQSTLQARDNRLHESIGFINFIFELVVDQRRLRWNLVEVRTFGIKIPKQWFNLDVSEYDIDGRYCFNVEVHVHTVGLLVHYAGWLQ